MREKGYVCVLTNPSFWDDWVKIGKSSRLPEVWGRELYNTAVPLLYEIYATFQTEKFKEAERMIHRSIDRVSDLRINKGREFFNIAPEAAYEILADIKELLGDEAILELKGVDVEVTKDDTSGTKRKVSQRFDFYSRGLKAGDVIKFVGDNSVTAIVSNERQVLFEEEQWFLSPLVKELYTRMRNVYPSGAYQGPAYFTFNGIKLVDLPIIKTDNLSGQ